VRWQEFFHGTDPFNASSGRREPILNHFWSEWATAGVTYGNREAGHPTAEVSNPVNISLPGYMSMFSGVDTGCLNNGCPRIIQETLIDRLSEELGFSSREMAAFSSWRQIAFALTPHSDGRITSNVSVQPLLDPEFADAELASLNRRQAEDLPPWSGEPPVCGRSTDGGGTDGTASASVSDATLPTLHARWDRYTWSQAMRYLRLHRPRFLYIGLGDTDEYGHRQEYEKYVEALGENDQRLLQLKELLSSLGDYGRRTAVILTTDHGRGPADQWGWHGTPLFPGANRIFLHLHLPTAGSKTFEALAVETTAARHADLRPTMEQLFGLAPIQGPGRGRSLVREKVSLSSLRKEIQIPSLMSKGGVAAPASPGAVASSRGLLEIAASNGQTTQAGSAGLSNLRPEVLVRALALVAETRGLSDRNRGSLREVIENFGFYRRYLDVTFSFGTGYPDRFALCVGVYPLELLEIEGCAATSFTLASLALAAKLRFDVYLQRDPATGQGLQVGLGPALGFRHLEWCRPGIVSPCMPSDGVDALATLQLTYWIARNQGVTLELDAGLGLQWIEEFRGWRDFMIVPQARALVGLSF
jgi:hypothetical protein